MEEIVSGANSVPQYTSESGLISSHLCARVLAYVQSLGIAPVLGVEIALECLRRMDGKFPTANAEGQIDPSQEEEILQQAMGELHAVMAERGVDITPTAKEKRLNSVPQMNRRVMIPEEMDISPLRSALRKIMSGKSGQEEETNQRRPGKGRTQLWENSAKWRRLGLLALILFPTAIAANVMYTLLPNGGYYFLRVIITILFAVLFAWISMGFWSSTAGLLMLLTRYDRFALGKSVDNSVPIPEDARTALLFPIYNEDARSVAAILKTVYQSLKEKGLDRYFDIFILSDTTSPDVWVQEEEAWHDLCREENAFGKIFYRRRKMNMKRKSGNIADFCRRWGANYRYMIVFDADSLISAESLARMVKTMEAHPSVGILQTPPKTIKARSLFARAQQFANHLYGPIFAAGLQYWQLGDAQYWGHNAIIRVEPFMQHCQLPSLPGKAPLGGVILSHDFVESALMRRAGYGVWLAYDLGESYEQSPPGLIEELVRDRRWCQGNLQHSRLLFAKGFFPTHRALFINGIMSYVSALLWFLFLVASSFQAVAELFVEHDYFPTQITLFPAWPEYFPHWALSLFSGTLTLLFLPKFFALIFIIAKGGAKAFGGAFTMTASMVAEVALSTMLAPVRMLFHSIFVIGTLLGGNWGWNAQKRDDSGTTWGEAVRFFWKTTLLGAAWGGLLYLVNPGFFLWMSPIAAGLVFCIPFVVWSSRVRLGDIARKMGLFLTPVETTPDKTVLELEKNLQRPGAYTPFVFPEDEGFIRAAVLPLVCRLHGTLNAHGRRMPEQKAQRLEAMTEKALQNGPHSLNTEEKIILLNEPDNLYALHRKVWALGPEDAARWGIR